MASLILRAATPILMMLLIIVSIYALLRGHHESGGGFIGGLLAAAAYSLHVLAHDVPSTRRLLGISPHRLIGGGMLTMALAGALGLVFGRSFLKGLWIHVPWPGMDAIHLGTPLIFDIGVYVVVAGVVMMIVFTLAEE